MTDRRDPHIMQVMVNLAESSPEAPEFEELEGLSGSRTGRAPVRLVHQPSPSPRFASNRLVALAVAASVLIVFAAVAVLFQAEEPSTPAITPEVDAVVSYTWYRVAHDDVAFGDGNQWMSSVTRGGPGLVAVGSAGICADAGVWTSADGVEWSRVPHDEAVFGDASMLSVTAGGPGLVAVGSTVPSRCLIVGSTESVAAVWTSVDGITWSRVSHDEATFGGLDLGDDPVMRSVVVGGPGLVAVGSDGSVAAVWTSVDGITWSRVPHDEATFGGASMNGVAVGGPGLVAVGSGGSAAAVWTSVDGHAWSRVQHDAEVFGGEGVQSALSVTAGGPGLVAVGFDRSAASGDEVWREATESHAAVWTSVDGITWLRVAHDDSVFGPDGGAGMRMSSVVAGGPGLVAVGGVGGPPSHSNESWRLVRSEASVWTSVDGLTWSRDTAVEDEFGLGARGAGMWSVTTGGPGLVAVGSVDASVGIYGGVWVAVPNG